MRALTRRAAILLAAVGLASPAFAQPAPQYRQLQLTDGRTLTAQILSTESTGLLMETPQGQSVVSFELLLDMVPVDLDAYERQTNWIVHVGGDPELVPDVINTFQAIPALQVVPLDQAGAGVTPAQAAAAGRCDLDVDCVARTLSDGTWRWVVMATRADEGIRLVGAVTTGHTRTRIAAGSLDPKELWTAAHDAILLKAVAGAPRHLRAGTSAPSPRPPSRRSSGAQDPMVAAFTPIPGLPALKEGDGAGFATALGIVVPTTAVWIGAVGKNAQSTPEAAALSLVGFYASTVIANQITGAASKKRARSQR